MPKKHIALFTAVLSLVYWLVESFMDTLVFNEPFSARLVTTDANELWMRGAVVSLIITFGIYSESLIKRLQAAEKRLMRMNGCFLSFGPDPVENINRLTELCGEILGSDAAFYNRLDHGMLCSWGQWNPPGDKPSEEEPEGHICYDLIRQGIDDVLVIRNLNETTYIASDPHVDLYGLKTYVGKSVRLGENVVGSLCALYKVDHVPSEDEKRLMGIVASAIGVEEVRKRAETALKESEGRLRHLSSELINAQEMERKRLARQLHDSVGQSLSALKFGIEETLEYLSEDPDERKLKPLRAAVPLIKEVVNEIRTLQRDLWPATLDDLGIVATINSFCKRYRDIYQNIRVETRIQVEESLVPKPLKPVIYRLLQEAMNNVAKHSGAEVVHICLREIGNILQLIIQDDGKGFDVDRARSPHFMKGLGLSSMKERAELSGGNFEIESTNTTGTRIEVAWRPDATTLSD